MMNSQLAIHHSKSPVRRTGLFFVCSNVPVLILYILHGDVLSLARQKAFIFLRAAS
jgi:hypothetical protein